MAWKDAPSKIYLQVCEESNCDQPFDSHIEISWCQGKINDSDISYVRADIAPPQRKPLTDDEIYECERVAAIRYQRHKNSIRGQQITAADNPQWHFAREIERAHNIEENLIERWVARPAIRCERRMK